MTDARWAQVKALFHAAADRPAVERLAFLAAAAGSDEALRREVESLLNADDPDAALTNRLLAHAVSDDPLLDRSPAPAPRLAFASGARLGPYEIRDPIGSGGMGEVYRARDSRLQRDVAIKILPVEATADPDRRQRFMREAQAIAALNHPNIVTIHSVEQIEDVPFVTMELVEGRTLRELIPPHGFALDRLIAIAIPLADAVGAAHARGIVHRDLKPANVMLTPEGRVKVLDFGLAKLMPPPLIGGAATMPAAELTDHGRVLGTVAYMSPEQAEGREVDHRSDIFSLGVLLYEMATGQRPFTGGSSAAILSAILKDDPAPLTDVNPQLPKPLARMVGRCLAKDPGRRYQAVLDLRLDLENDEALKDSRGATAGAVDPKPHRRAGVWPWAVTTLTASARNGRLAWMAAFAITLVAAVLAIPTVRHLRETPPALAVATHLELTVQPADQLVGSFASVRPSRTALAVSPNGRLVVFSATRGTVTQLYLRGLDRAEATPVPGTDGARGPFFSPDGAWIGFWADNKLKKVPTAGGPVAAIADAPQMNPPGFSGASWGEDGTIFFATGGPISKVSSAGGTPTPVATPDASKGERFLLPQPLPGGKALLFTATTVIANWETANVMLQSLDTGERRVLVPGGADARYVSTGHLVYMKTGTLMAVAFDPQSRQTGAAVALMDGVMQGVNARDGMDETAAGQFAVSPSGTLLYVVGGIGPIRNNSLVWVDRTGAAQPLAAVPAGPYGSPRLSPDGQKVALVARRGASRQNDLWVYDVLSGAPIRLTFGGGTVWPIWSPDSKRLVYGSNTTTTGLSNLDATNADGSGKPERLAPGDSNQIASSWSSAVNAIAFVSSGIWVLPMGGDRKPWLFLKSPSRLGYPEFSPNGRWMAYVSDESGANAVYVQPYPGGGEKIRISPDGGEEPIWVANGRELLYRTSSGQGQGGGFFSVAIRSLSPFRKEAPRLLFEDKANEYGHARPIRGWDVSADGQRFLLTRRVESTEKPVTVMHVVLNWTEELKRLVPTK